MMVECYGSNIEVPDILINKFAKDFEGLAGSGYREGVEQLRAAIWEVIDLIDEEPDLLNEKEYATDFVRALAMKQALANHGILFDA
jgi:hypothetical protein